MSTADHTGAPQRPCTATTQRGDACRAFALPERDVCAVHDPERAEAVQAARAKGGRVTSLQKRRRRLDSPTALARFNGNLVHQVIEGELPVDVARTVVSALSLQRALLEASELETRLAAVEEALAEGRLRRVG